MDDEGLFTVGRLSRRTGMPARTIRYWSDVGVLPPAGRSEGGYRLYDAGAVARLELVRTLRDLGLGLDDVRRVLERRSTLAEVAAVHVDALDARIRTLRIRRAVLSTVARRRSGTEETKLLNDLARLSAEERRRIVEDFVDDVFGAHGGEQEPGNRARHIRIDLPDDPTPEQVDAWVELAGLVRDPGFRRRMRDLVEHGMVEQGAGREPEGFARFAKRVVSLVGQARENGVSPGSPEAAEVVARLLGDADAAGRAAVRERIETGAYAEADRYRSLMAVINGREPKPSHADDFAWLLDALRA
ncbi:MerR family transcriptional regulator [Microbispora cellulosiformans]|uniref:MerR family transcriptional regulator n=1 Tax=Microbispora cellulosiformans TaxID=2614688 RepID=A0A5J5KBG0_9ACTN|nr:MerR family transcriptional regulator [Microbispora cellulosiformans]KAA9381289.1 MerR family transcriptional regulator [Microbispora cellulosiformans]